MIRIEVPMKAMIIRKLKNKIFPLRSKISYTILALMIGLGSYYVVTTMNDLSQRIRFNEAKMKIHDKLEKLDNTDMDNPVMKYMIFSLYEKAAEMIDDHNKNYDKPEGAADLMWFSYDQGLHDGARFNHYKFGSV